MVGFDTGNHIDSGRQLVGGRKRTFQHREAGVRCNQTTSPPPPPGGFYTVELPHPCSMLKYPVMDSGVLNIPVLSLGVEKKRESKFLSIV